MASIILSFVGQQDPFSKINAEGSSAEGSIVTLIRHLIARHHAVKRVVLIHTDGTASHAFETQDWLCAEIPTLSPTDIEILPVEAAFSDDPVNPLMAIQEALKALTLAKRYQTVDDVLELNASSGTPAMKASWSVVQALGYASAHSHVWQVRNPREMKPNQERVFYADVNHLKDELDRKIIQQQMLDYNYSGALMTLRASNLNHPVVLALLEYGFYRYSMNFDRAFSSLSAVLPEVKQDCLQEITPLRQKNKRALLQEAYFNALLRLKNRMYADFLVALFKIQENLLYYLVQEEIGFAVSGSPYHREESWRNIAQVDNGRLYSFLQNYRLPSNRSLDLKGSINRYTLQAIMEFYSKPVLPLIQHLNQYCDLRNRSAHELEGISEIPQEADLLVTLRKLMKQAVGLADTNPFDRLNQQIQFYLEDVAYREQPE